MISAAAVIGQMVVERLREKKPAWLEIGKGGLALAALSGILALAGIGFLSAALYLGLKTAMPPWQAAAAAGAILSGLAGLGGWAVARMIGRRRLIRANHHADEEIRDLLAALAEEMEESIEEPIRHNPKTAALLAGLAGFMAAGRMR